MSTKKAQSYSSIVGDIKVGDKTKGKNYKSYMKKLEENTYDKDKGIKKDKDKDNRFSILDKRFIDRRKLSTSSSNFNKMRDSQNDNNKIDIKISVNYSKQNSGLNSTKSKSFYQTSNASAANTIPSSKQSQYLNTHSDNFCKNSRAHKNSIDIKKNETSIEIEPVIKKRNTDKFYHPNLNISFNNIENKPLIHTVYTANALNNSFGKELTSFSNNTHNIEVNTMYDSCKTSKYH
jgi:hypothetical protein